MYWLTWCPFWPWPSQTAKMWRPNWPIIFGTRTYESWFCFWGFPGTCPTLVAKANLVIQLNLSNVYCGMNGRLLDIGLDPLEDPGSLILNCLSLKILGSNYLKLFCWLYSGSLFSIWVFCFSIWSFYVNFIDLCSSVCYFYFTPNMLYRYIFSILFWLYFSIFILMFLFFSFCMCLSNMFWRFSDCILL